MSINKSFFDFYLFADGWHSQGSDSQHSIPSASAAHIRMTEFSYDNKPDMWYQAEVVSVNSNKKNAKQLLDKFGLPAAVLVNCPQQKEEIFAQFLSLIL